MTDGDESYRVILRDGPGDFPTRMPPKASRVLSVEWTWGFLNSRFDGYRAWTAASRKRVYVWRKDSYWVEGQEPARFEPYCAGPLRGDLIRSALHCIEKAWEHERDEFDLDEPHMLGALAEGYQSDYDAMLASVWNAR